MASTCPLWRRSSRTAASISPSSKSRPHAEPISRLAKPQNLESRVRAPPRRDARVAAERSALPALWSRWLDGATRQSRLRLSRSPPWVSSPHPGGRWIQRIYSWPTRATPPEMATARQIQPPTHPPSSQVYVRCSGHSASLATVYRCNVPKSHVRHEGRWLPPDSSIRDGADRRLCWRGCEADKSHDERIKSAPDILDHRPEWLPGHISNCSNQVATSGYRLSWLAEYNERK